MNAPAARAIGISPFRTLPCLRCAEWKVGLLAPQKFKHFEWSDLVCDGCGASHFLMVHAEDGMWWAVYDRDTRRYPVEYYDERPFAVVKLSGGGADYETDEPFPDRGPISIFKRRRLSRLEIKNVWLQSDQKCWRCGKEWKLSEHKRDGWHIDHVIPNAGGGKETEMMENFKVACAKCNLSRGRGYTAATIRRALGDLFLQTTGA